MNEISAVIITYNEEKNIGRCLDSLMDVVDEIIVLDAWSTDRTIEIAKSKGAIVRQEKFAGYIQQKNKATTLASHDFILSMDADEALNHDMAEAILREKRNGLADAYYMKRCTNYCGRYIRNGTWYPDKKIRLFNRKKAKWTGINVHEKIELSSGATNFKTLQGDILHYSFPTIEEHIKKSDKYSSISAQTLYIKGKKSSWFKILVNPFWAFIHGYFLRLGFLDGFQGFAISINTAHATFLKYIKLYYMQHGQRQRNSNQWEIKPGIIKGKKKRPYEASNGRIVSRKI